MDDWIKLSDGKHSLVPNGESRYILTVIKIAQGFVVEVNDEPIDDGGIYLSLEQAKEAAWDYYHCRCSDFDE